MTPPRAIIRRYLNIAYMAGMARYNSGKINPQAEVEKLDQLEAELLAELERSDDAT